MKLKLLNKTQLTALYNGDLVRDFPKSELKPLKGMLNLMDRGVYDPLLVEENGKAVGYAMVWLPRDRKGALLEYFGVLPEYRNRGVGSRILDQLAEKYGQLFGEAEAPSDPDPAVNDLRRRRLGFYQRNGFRLLDYECALFGVHFNCLYRGDEPDDRVVEAMHRGVYAEWFSGSHLERYVQIPLRPGEAIHPAPEWTEEDDDL